MKAAVLTTRNEWFEPYAKDFASWLNSKLFFEHSTIDESYDTVFILGYHSLIETKYLKLHKHNIVVHESPLPQGKGWAPLFWQILEGKHEITFTMFEASDAIDNGPIYMYRTLHLTGYELHDAIREKQAQLTIEMCKEFINNYDKYKIPIPQIGKESFYPKRTPKDSKLALDKTIREQFNLLRIVNNEEFPAFFEIDGHRYILTIREDKDEA